MRGVAITAALVAGGSGEHLVMLLLLLMLLLGLLAACNCLRGGAVMTTRRGLLVLVYRHEHRSRPVHHTRVAAHLHRLNLHHFRRGVAATGGIASGRCCVTYKND